MKLSSLCFNSRKRSYYWPWVWRRNATKAPPEKNVGNWFNIRLWFNIRWKMYWKFQTYIVSTVQWQCIKMRDDVGHLFIYSIPNTQQSCVKLCQPWATSFPLGLVYPRWCAENVHLHGIIWCKKNPPKCKKTSKHHEAKKTKIIGKLSVEFCLATILRCCAKKRNNVFPTPYLDTRKGGATCSGILVDNKVVTS